jgi:hypothetical protein
VGWVVPKQPGWVEEPFDRAFPWHGTPARDVNLKRVLESSPILASSGTGVNPDMMRAAAVFLFGSALAIAQQSHQAMVNEHGDHVMGFSHEKTTHHFELNYDGGAIDVRANDAKDTESRDQIRSHFRHIAQMFAEGNFNAPALVHSTNVPGTNTMARLKDELHWNVQDTPRGARIAITADNQEALDAVHAFLRFQIEDHNTGDCPMVH